MADERDVWIKVAAEKGIQLAPEDFTRIGPDWYVDGMEPEHWRRHADGMISL